MQNLRFLFTEVMLGRFIKYTIGFLLLQEAKMQENSAVGALMELSPRIYNIMFMAVLKNMSGHKTQYDILIANRNSSYQSVSLTERTSDNDPSLDGMYVRRPIRLLRGAAILSPEELI